MRKIFSTLYSVFRSPSNGLSGMQWTGCSMVFAGLLGDIVRKMMPKAAAPPAKKVEPAEAPADTPPAAPAPAAPAATVA